MLQELTDFEMEGICNERYCGACHNGKTSFSTTTQCARCHIGVKGYREWQAEQAKKNRDL
jgi:putative SOS response-associated peptidase YedK